MPPSRWSPPTCKASRQLRDVLRPESEISIWSAENVDQLDWAMQSLKDAMAWDEKVYGREYDLDVFHIVAVNDFNMGAMENKGLNVFNTSCVLAKPGGDRRL